MTKVKTIQRWALCLRISIFILNAIVWLGALFAIICGLMVGFSNGTFSLDAEEDDDYVGGEIRWRDALYTTPATLLIYYGVLMLVTAIFGCFAGAGARRCCNITFVISIICTILFDIIFGYVFFWNPFAMTSFIKNLDSSMDNYGVQNGARFGVIPHHPTNYWDHLQRTGGCCGKFGTDEWRNKTIGSEKYSFSLPDSCCTKDYDYRKCGWRIWKHMEGDMDHYRSQMLKKLGCVTIFPEEVTTKYEEISYIVIILGLLMVVCAICSIVLLILIFTKKYKAGQGPQQLPRFARTAATPASRVPNVPLDYSINDENDSKYHKISKREIDHKSSDSDHRQLSSKGAESNLPKRQARTIPRLSIARGRSRIYPTDEQTSPTEVTSHRRHTITDGDNSPTPSQRRGTVYKPRADLTFVPLFVNKDFGTHSDIEALPVVYKGRAESRLRETTHDDAKADRGMSR